MKFHNTLKRKRLRTVFSEKMEHSSIMGVDGISTTKFSRILDDEIEIIRRKVKNGTYRFSPYREKLILKNRDSLPRCISVPTNRDRLTLRMLNDYLLDQFGRKKLETPSVQTIISEVLSEIGSAKYDSYVKFDIKNFFPSIDHAILMKKLKKKIKSRKTRMLIEQALKTPTVAMGKRPDPAAEVTTGVPQGLPLASSLSSVYMKKFDKHFMKMEEIAYFRYVDDVLILCKKEDIDGIIEVIETQSRMLKLTVHAFDNHSDKSSIGTIDKDSFQYLGYLFADGKVSIRPESVRKIEDGIIRVIRSSESDSKLYRALNFKITGFVDSERKQYGWLYFFSHMNDMTLLYRLDNFVKNMFEKMHKSYDEKRVKRFVRSYFELKKGERSNYIPHFKKKTSFVEKMKKSVREEIDCY